MVVAQDYGNNMNAPIFRHDSCADGTSEEDDLLCKPILQLMPNPHIGLSLSKSDRCL